MKKTNLLLAVLALALTLSLSIGAFAATATPELTQTLQKAAVDEAAAQATYDAILKAFGNVRPFSNIVRAEANHLAQLKTLFAAYGLTMPEAAPANITAPATVQEAIALAIKVETDDIAMYDSLLSQDLPDDVKAVFTRLRAASQRHLAAYERNAQRAGQLPSAGTAPQAGQNFGYGQGGRWQNDNDNAYGNSNFGGQGMRGGQGMHQNCPFAQNQNGQGGRRQQNPNGMGPNGGMNGPFNGPQDCPNCPFGKN